LNALVLETIKKGRFLAEEAAFLMALELLISATPIFFALRAQRMPDSDP